MRARWRWHRCRNRCCNADAARRRFLLIKRCAASAARKNDGAAKTVSAGDERAERERTVTGRRRGAIKHGALRGRHLATWYNVKSPSLRCRASSPACCAPVSSFPRICYAYASTLRDAASSLRLLFVCIVFRDALFLSPPQQWGKRDINISVMQYHGNAALFSCGSESWYGMKTMAILATGGAGAGRRRTLFQRIAVTQRVAVAQNGHRLGQQSGGMGSVGLLCTPCPLRLTYSPLCTGIIMVGRTSK